MKRKILVAVIGLTALFLSGETFGTSFFKKPEVIFKKGQNTWVKLETGNKKLTPFEHPRQFTAEEMENALSSIQYFKPDFLSITGKKGKEFALLEEKEVKLMAEHLAAAFAQAGPEEWVNFSINLFRGQILIGSFRLTDGVMFVKDGKLNIALRNIAVKTSPDQAMNTYDPTRGYRSFTRLAAGPGQEIVAENWIKMDAADIPKATPEQEPAVVPAPAPAPAAVVPPAAPAPVTTPAVESAPPETAPAPPAAPAKASAKNRLRQLQELYDEGMITKEEYEKKRAEILQEL